MHSRRLSLNIPITSSEVIDLGNFHGGTFARPACHSLQDGSLSGKNSRGKLWFLSVGQKDCPSHLSLKKPATEFFFTAVATSRIHAMHVSGCDKVPSPDHRWLERAAVEPFLPAALTSLIRGHRQLS
jgi:hypothetical protein